MTLAKSINNSALLIIEKVITIGLAFVTGILLARIAGPDTFGEYAYVLSFAGLFAPLCFMGLNNITAKYVIKYGENSHHYVLATLKIRTVGAIASIMLGVALVFYANNQSELSPLIINLLLLQSFQLFYIFEYYFLANNQVIKTLKTRLMILVISGILKLVIILNGADLTYLVTVHGLSYVFIALGYWLTYRNNQAQLRIKRPVNAHTLLALFHRGKWLLLSGLAAVIYLKIDQVMLAQMHSTETVGIYAAAARLSEFWYVFPVLIANAFNRTLVSAYKQNRENFNLLITQFLSLLIAVAITISFLTVLLADVIITFLYGEVFQESAAILCIHIFATVFIFQRAIFSKWLIIKGFYKYSLVTHGIGAISNVLLNLWLIPQYGGVGAAWATLISYIIASYISLLLFSRTRPFAIQMTQALLTWPFKLKLNHARYLAKAGKNSG